MPSSAVGALGAGEAYAEFYRQVETLGLDAVWSRVKSPRSTISPADG